MEKWCKILGYDYDYEISDYGNLRCLNPFHKKRKNINFKQTTDLKGYLRVGLIKDKKRFTIKTHRLVAEYFLPNFKKTLTVNHKDFNKLNNNLNNLELLSSIDNVLHYINGVVKKTSSSSCLGVGYHKQIKKWTARINIEGKRYSLGVFNTELEATDAIKNFDSNNLNLKIGKGKSNIGKCKYTEEQDLQAVTLSFKIGVRKAGKMTKMGSTRISKLRIKYKDYEIKQ